VFSPKELRKHHKKGMFIYDAIYWKLIDPMTIINKIDKEIEKQQKQKQELLKRINIKQIEILYERKII